MILSVSRRTDIPAFHSEWFMNRLRAGYVLVRNPGYQRTVYRVELTPRSVDCIIFITKDPTPMLRHLDEIEEMGYRYMFQVTVTPYGPDIEPGVGDKDVITDSFVKISQRIGKDRMLWRYDPILFSDSFDIGYHEAGFERICMKLQGFTERCVFSFFDTHLKLEKYVKEGKLRETTDAEKDSVGERLRPIAERYGMEMTSCCTDRDLTAYGIRSRGCFDRETMRTLGIPYESASAPLRDGCLCVKNVDVGAYDTCDHGCIYCYANAGHDGRRRGRVYDPANELLIGHVGTDDRIVPVRGSVGTRITDFI